MKNLLRPSELCDLFNYLAQLPVGSREDPVWRALEPYVVETWTTRLRYQVQSWCEGRLRNATGLPIPRKCPAKVLGAALPEPVIRWVPMGRAA